MFLPLLNSVLHVWIKTDVLLIQEHVNTGVHDQCVLNTARDSVNSVSVHMKLRRLKLLQKPEEKKIKPKIF